MKKDEIETISWKTAKNISFICSFGYKVLYYTRGKNRKFDRYFLRNLDTGEKVDVLRKDFYSFCKKKFGNLRMGEPPMLNPTALEYDRF